MAERDRPFRSYEGDEPYIFVSYSTKDSARVYPIMSKLHDKGYRIWYDEGITPGAEWSEEIADHLERCAIFALFVSPNSMRSNHVRREINMAIDRDKHLLCIYLQPTTLSSGMEMLLSLVQSIHYRPANEEDFYNRLEKVLSPAIGPTPPLTQEKQALPPAPEEKTQQKSGATPSIKIKTIATIFAALTLLVVVVVRLQPLSWELVSTSGQEGIGGQTSSITQDSQPELPASAEGAGSGVSFGETSKSSPGAKGNNGSNLNADSGFAAQKNGWVYVCWNDMVYQMGEDGSDIAKFSTLKDTFPNLNVIGDWVYIGMASTRVKADGSFSETLPYNSGGTFTGYGDSFYFLDWSQRAGSGISRVDLDGNDKVMLSEIYASMLYVEDGWVYYDDYRGDGSIWRVRIDGSGEEKYIGDITTRFFAVENGWLYYDSARYGICRRNIALGHTEELPLDRDIFLGTVIVREDTMYFRQDQGIWKLTLPDGEPKKLCDLPEGAYHFNVVDDWIFLNRWVSDSHPNGGIYRLPVEGGALEDITPFLEAASFR